MPPSVTLILRKSGNSLSDNGNVRPFQGPVSVPNHKLVPLGLLLLDARPGAVLARVDPAAPERVRGGGAAILLAGGFGLLRHPAYGVLGERFRFDDTRLTLVPPPGSSRALVNRDFAVYVRCVKPSR